MILRWKVFRTRFWGENCFENGFEVKYILNMFSRWKVFRSRIRDEKSFKHDTEIKIASNMNLRRKMLWIRKWSAVKNALAMILRWEMLRTWYWGETYFERDDFASNLTLRWKNALNIILWMKMLKLWFHG